MLIKTINKVKTEIYYLGHFVMQSLHREKVPDVDVRQNQFLESINICSDNGFRVRNTRQNTARTSSIKRQELPSSKKISVTPSAKKSKFNPKLPLFTSDEESSKNPTDASSKDKDGTLTNGKSTSDDESEKFYDSSSDDNSSSGSSSDEESKTSKHSLPNSATKTTSLGDVMHGFLTDDRSV
jgi:hypothetical protein